MLDVDQRRIVITELLQSQKDLRDERQGGALFEFQFFDIFLNPLSTKQISVDFKIQIVDRNQDQLGIYDQIGSNIYKPVPYEFSTNQISVSSQKQVAGEETSLIFAMKLDASQSFLQGSWLQI